MGFLKIEKYAENIKKYQDGSATTSYDYYGGGYTTSYDDYTTHYAGAWEEGQKSVYNVTYTWGDIESKTKSHTDSHESASGVR